MRAFIDSSIGLVGPATIDGAFEGGVCPNIRSSLLLRLVCVICRRCRFSRAGFSGVWRTAISSFSLSGGAKGR